MKSDKVVLTLRATPEQRDWMLTMAKSKGITMQAYFEEVMKKEPQSPWLASDETLAGIPNKILPPVNHLIELFRRDGERGKHWKVAVATLDAMLGIVREADERTDTENVSESTKTE